MTTRGAELTTLPGVTAETVATGRLTTRVLLTGPDDGIPVLFLHGICETATFWEETMLALPAGFRGIAPDQRSSGAADPEKKIDATRGLNDLVTDAVALLDHLRVDEVHLVGHSLGGAMIWRILTDCAARVLTATVVAPGSPYGFGGTRGLAGTPCWDDCAGSGGGIARLIYGAVRTLHGDEAFDGPLTFARFAMNQFCWKPPFRPAREDALFLAYVSQHMGEQDYPGDFARSRNWPNIAPGACGLLNAVSPRYRTDVTRLYAIEPKPPILWIRGADDRIISDDSYFDVGTLGRMRLVPGWPGEDVYPAQPSVAQTRTVLEQYAAAGGAFREMVFTDCGHTPHVEKPRQFNAALHAHLLCG